MVSVGAVEVSAGVAEAGEVAAGAGADLAGAGEAQVLVGAAMAASDGEVMPDMAGEVMEFGAHPTVDITMVSTTTTMVTEIMPTIPVEEVIMAIALLETVQEIP